MGIALKEAGGGRLGGVGERPSQRFCAWYLFRSVVLGSVRLLHLPRRIF